MPFYRTLLSNMITTTFPFTDDAIEAKDFVRKTGRRYSGIIDVGVRKIGRETATGEYVLRAKGSIYSTDSMKTLAGVVRRLKRASLVNEGAECFEPLPETDFENLRRFAYGEA